MGKAEVECLARPCLMEVHGCCEINRDLEGDEVGGFAGSSTPNRLFGSRNRKISDSTANGPNSHKFAYLLAGPC